MIVRGMSSLNSIVWIASFETLYGITLYIERSEMKLKRFSAIKLEHFLRFREISSQVLFAQGIESILRSFLRLEITNMSKVVK